tara:strand:- start:343 stop:573 length:231 start_codon:yes stop_codon:yes gene_type:complete
LKTERNGIIDLQHGMMKSNGGIKMKWFIILISGLLYVFSVIIRSLQGLEVDRTLTLLFMGVASLVFGAHLKDWFKQ